MDSSSGRLLIHALFIFKLYTYIYIHIHTIYISIYLRTPACAYTLLLSCYSHMEMCIHMCDSTVVMSKTDSSTVKPLIYDLLKGI